MEDKEFYTLKEITELLQVNIRSIYRWIDEGKLHATKIGRVWRVSKQDLHDFIENGNK